MKKIAFIGLLFWMGFGEFFLVSVTQAKTEVSLTELAQKEKRQIQNLSEHVDQTLAEQEEALKAIDKAKAWLH